ncbi:MAG: response regulator [Candidatus Cloacimonetes bacterium]|nr:response regulator [Candidatus Cloacimonadota bacterium]MCF7814670.1 response regulator [Candidatus Cloacimonadota bacterium]MCF7868232.1 response regulator [Candidatus Cloacimonadota bacterium]MCF7883665.1 response regulator [Candidatus Cloacimonadota bacterium]
MKKIKILIAEDEAIVAQYMTMELELEGYEVCCYVATGEEAIQATKKHKPDLILMDINLIGKYDGIETAEKILEFKSDIKLIFMTGYSRLEITERAKRLNPLGYFNKPLEVDLIQSIIEKAFSEK